jgi:SlyX protein
MHDDEVLIELQTLLAFQEQTIAELNNVLLSQQQQMDRLRAELNLVKEKVDVLEDRVEHSGSPKDDKPPHY